MSILDDFKLKLGSRKLKKDLRKFKRIREAKNMESATSAAILFTPTNEQVFEQIRDFAGYLSDFKIKVTILGYVHSKIISENLLFRKDIEMFSLMDLNWDVTPKASHVINFMDQSFDLFFDLSTVEYFPVKYVACLSKAKFKVSRFTDKYNSFDLMIEVDKNLPLDSYLENIKKYLNMINKPQTVKDSSTSASSWTLF